VIAASRYTPAARAPINRTRRIVGRYERLFKTRPPAIFAQFTERVPMVKGRIDKKASTATGYAWIVWKKQPSKGTRLVWIPACRKALEREGDYVPSPICAPTTRAGNVVPITKRVKEPDLFSEWGQSSTERGQSSTERGLSERSLAGPKTI
jgi:hypothetical protein